MTFMNLRDKNLDRATQAAEGMPRRRFTVAELEAMVAAGILDEDERIELVGGEVVPMPPKGIDHEVLKQALNFYWLRRLPDALWLAIATTFRLAPDTYLEPDFLFFDKATGFGGLNGKAAHFVVEIADSSFAYDIGRKAALYASFGIPADGGVFAGSESWHAHLLVWRLAIAYHLCCRPREGNCET